MTHPIAFLSDFGYRNEWVGICHLVITRSRRRARWSICRTVCRPSISVRARCCWRTRALRKRLVKRVSTYADLAEGEWGLMVDPLGWLSVIRGNPANAAAGLGVGNDDLVWLSRERD
jgi:S-adenosylmethionine hydrolase